MSSSVNGGGVHKGNNKKKAKKAIVVPAAAAPAAGAAKKQRIHAVGLNAWKSLRGIVRAPHIPPQRVVSRFYEAVLKQLAIETARNTLAAKASRLQEAHARLATGKIFAVLGDTHIYGTAATQALKAAETTPAADTTPPTEVAAQ